MFSRQDIVCIGLEINCPYHTVHTTEEFRAFNTLVKSQPKVLFKKIEQSLAWHRDDNWRQTKD